MGERLSNMSFGSLRMAFQLPTPHCRGECAWGALLWTYCVAAFDEHLHLLFGLLFALLLVHDNGILVRDPAHFALAFWHVYVGVIAECPGRDESQGRGEGEGDTRAVLQEQVEDMSARWSGGGGLT
jgi:hypothetical protein